MSLVERLNSTTLLLFADLVEARRAKREAVIAYQFARRRKRKATEKVRFVLSQLLASENGDPIPTKSRSRRIPRTKLTGEWLQMVRDLRSALDEACSTVIWMSGSHDFAPEGKAGKAWTEKRKQLEKWCCVLDSTARLDAGARRWSNGEGCNGSYKSPDPVHQHDDGTWWFFDETWGYELGPFANESSCREAVVDYAKDL